MIRSTSQCSSSSSSALRRAAAAASCNNYVRSRVAAAARVRNTLSATTVNDYETRNTKNKRSLSTLSVYNDNVADEDVSSPTLPPFQQRIPVRLQRDRFVSSSSLSSAIPVPAPPHAVRRRRPIYVAATRQHVGKTSTSLALLSGLIQRFPNRVGFCKPVGQNSVTCPDDRNGGIGEIKVDKDAALMKQQFSLHNVTYRDASPVLIPPGYTRDYVDGKITSNDQRQQIISAMERIRTTSDVVLCEGTGHCAVGSIVDASNAVVASWLDARMVLIANGGLGNTMDELELNKVLCDKHGVEIAGVIVNKVKPAKYEQTKYYLEKALEQKWGIPLLGCVPDRPFLGCPAIADLERCLEGSAMIAGRQHELRHYRVQDLNLVTTALDVFLKTMFRDPTRTLYVSHASRDDILLGFLLESQRRHHANQRAAGAGGNVPEPWQAAMVVTGCGDHPISKQVLDIVRSMDRAETAPPILTCRHATHVVMETVHHYTPKLNYADGRRVQVAVDHYRPFIDFDLLLERVGYHNHQEKASLHMDSRRAARDDLQETLNTIAV